MCGEKAASHSTGLLAGGMGWLFRYTDIKEHRAMTRIKLFGVVMIAAFAIFALVTSVAAAEEKTKMLPESGVTFTAKQVGEGKLVMKSGEEVKCKEGKGSGTIESANLGKYETLFEKCTSTGGSICTGEGDATGTILNKGTYHFWLALEELNKVANTLVGALVNLPEETKFGCTLLGVTVKVTVLKGCVAALATKLNTLVSTTTDTFAQVSAGVELITKVLPQEKTTEIECILLSQKGTGAFEQSSLVGVAENKAFENSKKELITVLLMNPEAKE
jgi:hypothetical protein